TSTNEPPYFINSTLRAAIVPGPTIPSTAILWSAWNRRPASFVNGPKIPSIAPGEYPRNVSASWTARTSSPLSPYRIIERYTVNFGARLPPGGVNRNRHTKYPPPANIRTVFQKSRIGRNLRFVNILLMVLLMGNLPGGYLPALNPRPTHPKPQDRGRRRNQHPQPRVFVNHPAKRHTCRYLLKTADF